MPTTTAGALRSLVATPPSDLVAELKPVETIRSKGQEIRRGRNARELRVPQHLNRYAARERAQIEFNWLHAAAEIRDAQNDVGFIEPEVRQDLVIGRTKKLDAAQAEHFEQTAQSDHVPDPVQQRGGLPLFPLDVDRLKAENRIGQHRAIELAGISSREAGVLVAIPVHRRAHTVPVAQLQIVAHADLVAVVDDR